MSFLPFNNLYGFLNPGGSVFQTDFTGLPKRPPLPQSDNASPVGGLLENMLGPYGGLLSPEDRQASINRGLLGAGAALLQASGPSRMPIGTGQALGQALNAGLGSADAFADRQVRNQILRSNLTQKQTTDFQRDLEAAGIDPKSPEGQQILKSRYDKNILNPLQLAQLMDKQRELQKPSLSSGQEAVDKKFADEYVEFKAAGGFADVQKNIGQLNDVLGQLESGKNLTGPVLGRIGDTARSVFAPESQSAKEAVEEVVQRNLRLVLGAQFTEKEGERLISRAYNPSLSENENAKRLRRLVSQIGTAAQAKQEAVQYFEDNGTLKGFKGKIYTMADFSNLKFDEDRNSKQTQSSEDIQTWTFGGFEYRRLPDGTVQRRRR